MGTFSPVHWLIVLAVVVLLFGAKKIPDFAKNLGIGIKEFKKSIKDGEKDTGTTVAKTDDPTTKSDSPQKTEKKDDAAA